MDRNGVTLPWNLSHPTPDSLTRPASATGEKINNLMSDFLIYVFLGDDKNVTSQLLLVYLSDGMFMYFVSSLCTLKQTQTIFSYTTIQLTELLEGISFWSEKLLLSNFQMYQ